MDTRVKPAYDAEYVSASFSNSDSSIQTAKLSYSRGAVRPRFANPSRTPRGDGAMGGARAPMGTPEAGFTHLARQGTARAQGKAQRLPALHRPPGHQPFRGAPVRPAFALSAEGSPLEALPHRQDPSRISEVVEAGIGIHSQVRERRLHRLSCPGRSAAWSTCGTLRCRAGAVTNAGVWYGPGSAKQRFAKSCALHRARDTRLVFGLIRIRRTNTLSCSITPPPPAAFALVSNPTPCRRSSGSRR